MPGSGDAMVASSVFAGLVARPIDRVHIAASQKPAPEELRAVEGLDVPAVDAAFVVSFLATGGMTWKQLRVPLRYAPEDRIRSRLADCVESGVITFDDDFLAYTTAGRAAAVAVLDCRAVALEAMWSNTPQAVSALVALAAPVAAAATAAGTPSSHIVDQALASASPTDGSKLWRAVAKIRRYRADCHVEAWTEAGHTVASISAVPVDAPERALIEARTNELNAEIWAQLPEADQLPFVSYLAGLDGSGTPV